MHEIPTEPIGSFPRPPKLIDAVAAGPASPGALEAVYDEAMRDTIELGTTDDSGFSSFFDDRSTSRATAFAKIRARVDGTALASTILAG